ncbi:hypothetical protein H4582DRAFT_2060444 [Lactarius indigo]|nr:hypothetical protein H4582DRAFT_2060444 [Lactarius indigo]
MHCAFLPDDINVDGNHRLISPPTTLPAGITTCSLYLPIIFLSLRCPLHKFLNSLTNVIRTLNPTLDEDPILPVIAELEMVTQSPTQQLAYSRETWTLLMAGLPPDDLRTEFTCRSFSRLFTSFVRELADLAEGRTEEGEDVIRDEETFNRSHRHTRCMTLVLTAPCLPPTRKRVVRSLHMSLRTLSQFIARSPPCREWHLVRP